MYQLFLQHNIVWTQKTFGHLAQTLNRAQAKAYLIFWPLAQAMNRSAGNINATLVTQGNVHKSQRLTISVALSDPLT